MYKLSVPIMFSTAHPGNRAIYVKQCKDAGASRIFLCNSSPLEPFLYLMCRPSEDSLSVTPFQLLCRSRA